MTVHPDHRPTRAVLFDLDGTLVDTSFLHAVTWWQALRQHGHLVTTAAIHRAVGLGSDKILDQLLDPLQGADRDRDGDDEIVTAQATLVKEWHERVAPLPGAADLLRRCAEAGVAVVLATSAGDADLEALRRVLDADDAVTCATTSADAEHSKPDTDILTVALKRAQVGAAEAVFVGDSVWDMMASRRLGLRCIGLECGGTSAAELVEAGADEVWRDPGDLLEHLGDSLLRGLTSSRSV